MSKLLEILGKAITVNTADLLWHWLGAVQGGEREESYLDGRDEFEEIVELLGNIDLDKAEEKLKFYLFENPQCVRGRMAAVVICLHRGQVDAAIEQLQSIYRAQPSNTMALYALGHCYERVGHEAEAIEFYQDCLKFKNHLQLPRQRMAAIYFKNGRSDKTIWEYEQLTTEHPEDIGAMITLGYLYVSEGQYEKAVETFNTAIIAHPDNFHDDSQDEEINQYVEAGDFDAAIEHVQNLKDCLGDIPEMDVKMADVLSKAGRAAEAIAHYENAIRNEPNYLEATIKLGTHYLRLRRMALAAEQFNRAVEINDEIVDTYIGLAVSQSFSGKTEDSYGTLSLASAIQQNSTLLFSETCCLHFKVTFNDQVKAIEPGEGLGEIINDVIMAHRQQIEKTPSNADVHYKYGMLMMVVGNVEDAVKSFKKAMEINPTHYRAHTKLLVCLYETGRKDEAFEKLRELQALDVASLELHYQTALLYCNRQKFAEALWGLESTMQNNFTQADATVNVEVVLENLGLVDRAVATWDRLTEAAHNSISQRYL